MSGSFLDMLSSPLSEADGHYDANNSTIIPRQYDRYSSPLSGGNFAPNDEFGVQRSYSMPRQLSGPSAMPPSLQLISIVKSATHETLLHNSHYRSTFSDVLKLQGEIEGHRASFKILADKIDNLPASELSTSAISTKRLSGLEGYVPLRREDYPLVTIWTQKEGKTILKKSHDAGIHQIGPKHGKNSDLLAVRESTAYIQDTFGNPINEGRARELCTHARRIWKELENKGIIFSRDTWKGHALEAVEYYYAEMYKISTELQLCGDPKNWKVERLAVDIYPNFHRQMQPPKSTVKLESVDENTGQKRKRDASESGLGDPIHLKREGVTPTPFSPVDNVISARTEPVHPTQDDSLVVSCTAASPASTIAFAPAMSNSTQSTPTATEAVDAVTPSMPTLISVTTSCAPETISAVNGPAISQTVSTATPMTTETINIVTPSTTEAIGTPEVTPAIVNLIHEAPSSMAKAISQPTTHTGISSESPAESAVDVAPATSGTLPKVLVLNNALSFTTPPATLGKTSVSSRLDQIKSAAAKPGHTVHSRAGPLFKFSTNTFAEWNLFGYQYSQSHECPTKQEVKDAYDALSVSEKQFWSSLRKEKLAGKKAGVSGVTPPAV